MPHVNSNLEFHERIEILLRAGAQSFRGRPVRFWNDLAGFAFGRVASSVRGDGVDSFTFPAASLFVFDRRVMVTGWGRQWLDAGLRILDRLEPRDLETVIYQAAPLQASAERDFRRRLSLLRSESGILLGPAVVAEGTALFYPPHVRRSSLKAIGLQLTMSRPGSLVSGILKQESFARRQAGFDALGIKADFTSFELQEHHSANQYCLLGARGGDCFVLRVGRTSQSGFASFDASCSRRTAFTEFASAAERLIAIFNPRQHCLRALHSEQVQELPGLYGGYWQTSPLGPRDSISILVGDEAKSTASATA